MPVTLRAACAAVLVLAACSSGSNDTDAGPPPVDAGPDAGSMCTDDVNASCTAQADCFVAAGEEPDSVHVYTCGAGGRCDRQGGFTSGCFANVTIEQVTMNLSPEFGNASAIHSFQIRALYASNVDGSALACADVLGSANFPDGGSPLDVNPNLNVEEVLSVPPNCPTPGACSYSANTSLITGTNVVVLVDAYTGAPDTTGVHSQGMPIGTGGCTATTVTANGTVTVTVNP